MVIFHEKFWKKFYKGEMKVLSVSWYDVDLPQSVAYYNLSC